MTIEQILGLESPEQIEKMTDAQLLEYFKPYLNITRPELAPKPERSVARKVNDRTSSARQRLMGNDVAKGLLASFGVDLDEL